MMKIPFGKNSWQLYSFITGCTTDSEKYYTDAELPPVNPIWEKTSPAVSALPEDPATARMPEDVPGKGNGVSEEIITKLKDSNIDKEVLDTRFVTMGFTVTYPLNSPFPDLKIK